jgi:uncharacterized protein YjaG (DUF416 family)
VQKSSFQDTAFLQVRHLQSFLPHLERVPAYTFLTLLTERIYPNLNVLLPYTFFYF